MWDISQYPRNVNKNNNKVNENENDIGMIGDVKEIGLCGYIERFPVKKLKIGREICVHVNEACLEEFSQIMYDFSGRSCDWNVQLFIRLNPLYN